MGGKRSLAEACFSVAHRFLLLAQIHLWIGPYSRLRLRPGRIQLRQQRQPDLQYALLLAGRPSHRRSANPRHIDQYQFLPDRCSGQRVGGHQQHREQRGGQGRATAPTATRSLRPTASRCRRTATASASTPTRALPASTTIPPLACGQGQATAPTRLALLRCRLRCLPLGRYRGGQSVWYESLRRHGRFGVVMGCCFTVFLSR